MNKNKYLHAQLKEYLGKKVLCEREDGIIEEGRLREFSLSTKYLNVVTEYCTFDSSNWIKIEDIIHMEELPPNKKRKWWMLSGL